MKAICFFFAVALLALFNVSTVCAQTKAGHDALGAIRVSDLMPLGTGQYVDYNETDTIGSKIAHKHASYIVLQSNLTFQGLSGVSLVSDTSAKDQADTAIVDSLHYHFDQAGNLQVFADQELLASVLGPTLAPGAQAPNIWITELRTDNGTNQYIIDTMHSTYLSLPVVIVFAGRYVGAESVVVPGFPSGTMAQRFDLTGYINVGGGLLQDSSTQSQWLVNGIGVVRTSLPRLITHVLVADTQQGTLKEMTSYGVAPAAVSEPNQGVSSGIHFYPDPASENVTLSFDHPARRVMLYDAAGSMVRSFDLASNTGDALLWVKDIPNGVYLARVQFANGTSAAKKLVIQH